MNASAYSRVRTSHAEGSDIMHAVSGGSCSTIVRGTNGGFSQDGEAVEIWNNGKYYGSISGGHFFPCTAHCPNV